MGGVARTLSDLYHPIPPLTALSPPISHTNLPASCETIFNDCADVYAKYLLYFFSHSFISFFPFAPLSLPPSFYQILKPAEKRQRLTQAGEGTTLSSLTLS